MKRKYYLLIAGLWLSLSARAQQWELLRTFPVEAPVAVTADVHGQLYVATTKGEIVSYSPEGQPLYTFSPQSAGAFTALEAPSGRQLWAFDENRQQLLFLDRFLNQLSSQQLPADVFSYVVAVTRAAGNAFWMADAGDMQLKQWNSNKGQLVSSIRLNLLDPSLTEIRALKEYQHRLYLFSPDKLLVFDQLGAFGQSIPLPAWQAFSFAEDNVLLLTRENLIQLSIHSGEQASGPLPPIQGVEQLVFSKGVYYFFSESMAHAYRRVP